MNWNDMLCGVPVTPESWVGGVIQRSPSDGGKWCWVRNAKYWFRKPHPEYARLFELPIFPPRGWAGKSDAELWDAVVGPRECEIANISTRKSGISVTIDEAGCIGLDIGDGYTVIHNNEQHIGEAAALILALQNAQVLAARLAVKP